MEFRDRTDSEFLEAFTKILQSHNDKNNTFKFALARFLLEYSRESSDPMVRFREIAKYFFKYYWLQECKSRIRQGPPHQTPKVITIIRERFTDKIYLQTYGEILRDRTKDVEWCISEIQKNCFRDVIHRFHHAVGDQKIFFDYRVKRYQDKSGNALIDVGGGIRINPNAMRFFKEYYQALHRAVILEWIRFLEKRNFGIPHLVKKIEGTVTKPDVKPELVQALKSFTYSCFYCERHLDLKPKPHVDHVIPFEYVGDTELWNLVLTCQECNSEKLGRLAPLKYLEKLLDRNICYQHNNKMNNSLKMLNYGAESIRWHYKNAYMYGYPIVNDFPKIR